MSQIVSMIFIGDDISQITDPINFPLAVIGADLLGKVTKKSWNQLSEWNVILFVIYVPQIIIKI